jgi:Ser/Thr protein kinase RdoA (MazF antagonist)
MLYNRIKHVLPRFRFEGAFESVEELCSGNINNTYCLTFRLPDGGRRRYTLQAVNSYVFKDPQAVMRNMERITAYLRGAYQSVGVDPAGRMLTLVPTYTDENLYRDERGTFWRVCHFIEGATAHNLIQSPAQFEEAGHGFGEFQRLLRDFPADTLIETIPNFHNTPQRFYAFVAALGRDQAGRAREVEREIDFLFDRRKLIYEVTRRIESGELPLRATHNDTKINNVMLDDRTGKAICVIDLDTVMPGSVLYDFGDAIRFGASTAAEDEPDTSKISLDLELFERFASGYLAEVNGFLSEEELRLLPLGVRVITCEQVMRFLTDYLDGDLYFKVNGPQHNLIRARAQMRLLEDIEAKYDRMCRMIEDML